MKRWSFVVGIGKPLHAELGGQPFADADAAALDAALGTAGIPKANRILLTGQYATKAAVESRLRKLKKSIRKGDRVVVAWFGNGILDCWDTLPDDRKETSLALRDLSAAVGKWKADQVVFLLSVPGLRTELLEEFPNVVGLLACGPDEEPLGSPDVPGGVWTRLLVEALEGRAAKALDDSRQVTAGSLQRYLEAELPRLVRRHFDAGAVQAPRLIGNPKLVLVDAAAAKPADSILDPARLRRVVFRSDTTVAVRELSDFRKGFSLPEKAGSASRRFVQRLAAKDIRTELDRVAERCRERFGHRRKDLSLAVGQDGTGSLRTPDFEFAITVEMDEADSSRLVWRRELGRFADLAFARSTEFGPGFGPFDQLVFEPAKPIDVREFADRLEESPPSGAKLTFGDDRTCELALRGFPGSIRVSRHSVVVRGTTANASGLFDLLIAFLTRIGSPGDAPALRSKPAPSP